MCGASLEEQAESEPAPPVTATRHFTTRQVIILASIAVFILVASVILGWNLSQKDVSSELPTFTPTITSSPTATSSPTPTPTPTLTPTPLPTPTPIPPQTYTVQSGDTLLTIAMEFDITVDEIKALNGLDSDIIVEGQGLLIPPPTPTPGPTPTPKPGEPTSTPAAFILHTVKPGDTLSTIAEQYGVSVADLRAANDDIAPNSDTIKVDQVLTIPRHTPTPEVQAEPITNGTPTPRPAYPAPVMLYPPDGAAFTGPDALVVLQWASVGILEDREFYQVEFIVPSEEGKVTVNIPLRSTAWRVPAELFPAPDVSDRECTWRVSVVRQVTQGAEPNYQIISQMGRRRTFTWSVAQP